MATVNPPVPLTIPLGQLRANDVISVSGTSLYGSFSINLDADSGNNAFHFNPRFGEHQVVRNAMIGGQWGAEERHGGGFPFLGGQPFEVILRVAAHQYKVTVNGRHYCVFSHRLPKETVTRLRIVGDVTLQAVRYPPANPYRFVPAPNDGRASQQQQQLLNPPVPFSLPLGLLRANDFVFISGRALYGSFSLNFETDGGDNAFHFNPRFNEKQVVRNTLTRGCWGTEERHGGFPFTEGQHFDIAVLVQDALYKVAVNGVHYIDFCHRLSKEIVRQLCIRGDVVLHSVLHQPVTVSAPAYPSFSGQPMVYPETYGHSPSIIGPSNPALNPPTPYTSLIVGRMYPGRMIRVGGVAKGDRFTINLQCGPHAGTNVALHFDVRFRAGSCTNVVVRNSFISGAWGHEERHGPYFPFVPNGPFDVILLAEATGFKVAVNNQHYTDYAHRLPLGSVEYINISGDLQINMVQVQ